MGHFMIGCFELKFFCALSHFEFGLFHDVSFVMGHFLIDCFELGSFCDRSFCMCN
jgi:hypothetical protein